MLIQFGDSIGNNLFQLHNLYDTPTFGLVNGEESMLTRQELEKLQKAITYLLLELELKE